ncbi:MAG: undecaprenyl-phosphate galactose phosphotransferase WbaP [Anaerolineales bacterium]
MKNEHKKIIKTRLLENRNQVVNILLVLLDIITISLAVFLAAGFRSLLIPFLGGVLNWPIILNGLVFYLIFIILFAWLNSLYPGFGLAAVHEMQKIVYVVTMAIIFLGVYLFLQQLGLAFSRFVFVMTWVLSALLMMLGRFGLRNVFSKFDWWGIPVVVVGYLENVEPVIEKLQESRRLGFRPVFYHDPSSQSTQPIHGIEGIDSRKALHDLALATGISHIVFTNTMDDAISMNLHWMRDVFPNILFVLNTAPFGSLWVRPVDLHGTLAIETNYHLLNRQEMIIKRILDMILSVILLLFSWPLFLFLALLVRIDSKGPILYTQKRLGKNGKPFDSFKFRTMYDNAEEKLEELLAEDRNAFLEYEKYHKLTNDPRVTRVGKILRRYSLDELPQLINVIKGDMNLIGPRSYLPRELQEMGDYARIILKVKPGLTGWWQVMGRNATSFQERMQLDEYYISNSSICLDIYINIKTIWVLAKGRGL